MMAAEEKDLVERVDIDSVSLDPSNARLHNDKNLAAIKASLKRFGQQKPIVVDSGGVIFAGNGTYAAARALGWKRILVIRSALNRTELTAYAIADNRTAELADWDNDVLASTLGSLNEEGIDPSELGFDEKAMAKLLQEEAQEQSLGDEKFMVVVNCSNEQDQCEFLEQMQAAGRQCRALVG